MTVSEVAEQLAFSRDRLAELIDRKRDTYRRRHPRSLDAFDRAGANLLGGVPMTWMRMWAGGFPLYLELARGARLVDLDGNSFTDFCLGDTGAMAGHSPGPTGAAMARRFTELGGVACLRSTAAGDVAAVLMEPALTNIGIVLPEPGYLDAVRVLTREHGSLLINDETHTFSAGPGGCTRAWNLSPDIVTIGKSIGGGGRAAGRAPAPVHGQPGCAADPVPQHGPHVAGDHRGPRRYPHRGVRIRRRRAAWLTRHPVVVSARTGRAPASSGSVTTMSVVVPAARSVLPDPAGSGDRNNTSCSLSHRFQMSRSGRESRL